MWLAQRVVSYVSAAASMWPLTVMLIVITSLVEHFNRAEGILTSPLGEL